jgi:DNA-binding SARP family transcriptional activator/sugar lactone lactonase YvrE
LPAPDDAIEFRILGPLEASRRGQALEVGAGKQRALLVVLLLSAGEVVSTDRLIDALWGERPPPSALNSVHIYVSRLRKLLGNGRLETRGPGYLLVLDPEQLDLGRFDGLLGDGRDLLASGEPDRAAEALRDALGLWRGPPLADVASEPFAQAEIARLEELRLAALEERIEADLAVGRAAELVPELEGLIHEHPLRERLRAQLMLALYRSGRQSEALDAYQQARRLLSTELGLEPGRELRELEAAILRQDAQLHVPSRPTKRTRAVHRKRRSVVAIGAALLVAAAVALIGIAGGETSSPPRVLPNSLVRVDSDTLEATDVVRVGSAPDLVVAAGGFVWITHHILRDFGSDRVRDAGDRTLERVDPETGEVETVGGGLAPCGLAPDPSGDVWVANCFASGGRDANVVRVDATTLDFEATYPVPEGDLLAAEAYYRGLAYGGGSLWLGFGEPAKQATVTQVDPQSGKQRAIRLPNPATGALAWAETSGDLWVANFGAGTLTRLHASTQAVETVNVLSVNPGHILVDGEVVWVGDWEHPGVERLSAVGPSGPRLVELPARNATAGVWNIAAGEGYIWATTPRDGALWRIDPKTNDVKRIPMPYPPTGVTANEGDVWVTVRRTCDPGCPG